MSLPSFNFLYIQAGEGKTGTSGEQLEVMWTTNFNLIKSLFESLDQDVQNRILSNDIKQMKVENGVAYFTTDGEEWISLGPSFANLAGDPDENEALVEKFSNYVTIVTFNALNNRLSLAESSIILLQGDVVNLQNLVGTLRTEVEANNTGLLARVAVLETSVAHKISSQSVVEIREHSEGELEYTIDGVHWYGVSESDAVTWGNILGNISDQADLQLIITNINEAIAGLTPTVNSARDHMQNYNNPHQVTKAQLGLGNVDNTADADKPVSTAQKAYIDGKANVTAMSTADYEALTTVEANSVYLITDKTQ